MDYHINDFFQRLSDETSRGKFFEVVPLHERSDLSWEKVTSKVPSMPKGWYELTHISSKDRIEFTFDRWSDILPVSPPTMKHIESFFESLDDICLFLVQVSRDDPFEAQMVYSIKDNGGFYRGGLPANENSIVALQKAFSQFILPADFLAFLRLHDGFWKTTDSTGVTTSKNMRKLYEQFQMLIAGDPPVLTSNGERVDPQSLIPFYESFGMPYFQCFWSEWYPEQEMGNVYYSSETKTISKINDEPASETLAFPTFGDWLAFYLERID